MLILLLCHLGSLLKHPLGDLRSSLKRFRRYLPCAPESNNNPKKTAEVAWGRSLGFLGKAKHLLSWGAAAEVGSGLGSSTEPLSLSSLHSEGFGHGEVLPLGKHPAPGGVAGAGDRSHLRPSQGSAARKRHGRAGDGSQRWRRCPRSLPLAECGRAASPSSEGPRGAGAGPLAAGKGCPSDPLGILTYPTFVMAAR